MAYEDKYQPDYTTAGNYWRWLERRFNAGGIQFVSDSHRLKLEASDGKQRVFECGLLNSCEPGDIKCLQQIHTHLFGGVYEFAG